MSRNKQMLMNVLMANELQSKVNSLSTALDGRYGDVSGTPNGLIYDLKADLAAVESSVTGDFDNLKTDVSQLVRGEVYNAGAQAMPTAQGAVTISALTDWAHAIAASPSEVSKYCGIEVIYTPPAVASVGAGDMLYIKLGTSSLALTGGTQILTSMPSYLTSKRKPGAYQPSSAMTTGVIEASCGHAYNYYLEPGNGYYIPNVICDYIDISCIRDIGKGLSVWVWLAGTVAQSVTLNLVMAGS